MEAWRPEHYLVRSWPGEFDPARRAFVERLREAARRFVADPTVLPEARERVQLAWLSGPYGEGRYCRPYEGRQVRLP